MMAQKCAKNDSDVNCSATSPRRQPRQQECDGWPEQREVHRRWTRPSRTVTVTAGAKETGSAATSLALLRRRLRDVPAPKSRPAPASVGQPVKGDHASFAARICRLQVSTLSLGSRQHGTKQILDSSVQPAAAVVPGGFGWIVQMPAASAASPSTASARRQRHRQHGSPVTLAPVHRLDVLGRGLQRQMNDQTVLLPAVRQCHRHRLKRPATIVKGFAAFHVTGYKFARCTAGHNRRRGHRTESRAMRGYFVKFVSLVRGLELGPCARLRRHRRPNSPARPCSSVQNPRSS